MHILARSCATKQLPTESLATNIGTIPKNMPTNFQLKRLKLKLDIVEKPENRVHKLTDSNGAPLKSQIGIGKNWVGPPPQIQENIRDSAELLGWRYAKSLSSKVRIVRLRQPESSKKSGIFSRIWVMRARMTRSEQSEAANTDDTLMANDIAAHNNRLRQNTVWAQIW